MSAAPLDRNRNVPSLVALIANRLSSSASNLYRKRLGVGIIEWRVMFHLAIEADASANRIAQVVGLDKAAVSRAVRSLEARGLVAVTAADGRRNALALTEEGRRLHERGMPIARERERRLLAGLSPAERETLIDLLGRMTGQLASLSELANE